VKNMVRKDPAGIRPRPSVILHFLQGTSTSLALAVHIGGQLSRQRLST